MFDIEKENGKVFLVLKKELKSVLDINKVLEEIDLPIKMSEYNSLHKKFDSLVTAKCDIKSVSKVDIKNPIPKTLIDECLERLGYDLNDPYTNRIKMTLELFQFTNVGSMVRNINNDLLINFIKSLNREISEYCSIRQEESGNIGLMKKKDIDFKTLDYNTDIEQLSDLTFPFFEDVDSIKSTPTNPREFEVLVKTR